MKKIKYMFMGAMMTVISAPVMAQTDAASITKQVAEIIKSAPVKDATKQVSALAKTYKKNLITTEIYIVTGTRLEATRKIIAIEKCAAVGPVM